MILCGLAFILFGVLVGPLGVNVMAAALIVGAVLILLGIFRHEDSN